VSRGFATAKVNQLIESPFSTGPFPSASLYAVSKQLIEQLPPSLQYSADYFTKFYLKKYAGKKQPKERKGELT
jgi:hypothetical protein